MCSSHNIMQQTPNWKWHRLPSINNEIVVTETFWPFSKTGQGLEFPNRLLCLWTYKIPFEMLLIVNNTTRHDKCNHVATRTQLFTKLHSVCFATLFIFHKLILKCAHKNAACNKVRKTPWKYILKKGDAFVLNSISTFISDFTRCANFSLTYVLLCDCLCLIYNFIFEVSGKIENYFEKCLILKNWELKFDIFKSCLKRWDQTNSSKLLSVVRKSKIIFKKHGSWKMKWKVLIFS